MSNLSILALCTWPWSDPDLSCIIQHSICSEVQEKDPEKFCGRTQKIQRRRRRIQKAHICRRRIQKDPEDSRTFFTNDFVFHLSSLFSLS